MTKRTRAEIDRRFAFHGRLGAEYSEAATTFRLWAPLAESAQLLLYRSGSGGEPVKKADMTRDGGVWSVRIDGDCHGAYYTYLVTTDGVPRESIDPYAVSAGANGKRGMVLDLRKTDPVGWENDKPVRLSSPADAVIYELHVRDFSMDESGSFANRGKFAAFCEKNVTNRFGDKIGLDYIADLGVTHIHLLPIFDFATVDEESLQPQFNWGYDPLNYNVPEGSYSISPQDGASRVRELKRLVMAAHRKGLGVVMDVVYNHT
ncbi:MAG: alpha-amylase family glycosyl hydrolase, partial [Oscillospiraceae bacterium]